MVLWIKRKVEEKYKIQFGIPLISKVVQTAFYKAIERFIKSIIKVIKKYFFIKKENEDNKFALKKEKNEL